MATPWRRTITCAPPAREFMISERANDMNRWASSAGAAWSDRCWSSACARSATSSWSTGFFSTSQAGAAAPDIGRQRARPCKMPTTSRRLARLPILISTQGGDYTRPCIHACARPAGGATGSMRPRRCAWRTTRSSCSIRSICRSCRRRASAGIKDFIGGNCTVSLMLMAVGGLMRAGLVEWITAMTYQSASGAGAQNMRELLEQMGALHASARRAAERSGLRHPRYRPRGERTPWRSDFPTTHFGAPLAAASSPGSTRIWATAKAARNGRPAPRRTRSWAPKQRRCRSRASACASSAMRCHSQALTIKLKRDVPLAEIERIDCRRQRLGAGRGERRKAASIAALVAGGGQRQAGQCRSAACASSRWAANTSRRLRSATSCCGAPPSRCAATMRFLLPHV